MTIKHTQFELRVFKYIYVYIDSIAKRSAYVLFNAVFFICVGY